jgi:RNA polymerase sigma-70 factor, ECF subfamily
VLGWSAREATDVLGLSVAAVNSGLQRARLTMRVNLPQRRSDWTSTAGPSTDELSVLRRFMAALERADDHAVAALLREDVLVGHQGRAGGNLETRPVWYAGRQTVIDAWAPILHGPHARQLRIIPTRANRQPAYGTYARVPGSGGGFDPFAFSVLQVERGAVTEVLTFGPELFAAFGLPTTVHGHPLRTPRPTTLRAKEDRWSSRRRTR